MSFDFNAYLNRIGIAKPEATLAGLCQLQQAQLGAIAFENINPLLGLLPELETAALMEKIVANRRGGYCFELNGLFGQALDELGFAYQPIMARVRMGRNEGGPRLHLAFIVEAEGDSWLVDAGFGGPSHYRPLRLNTEQTQSQDHNQFRLRQEAESGETVLEIADTVTDIYRVANLEFVGGVQKSGVALSFHFQECNSTLGDMAENCEAAEVEIASLVYAWQGKTFTGNIAYPKDFNLSDLQTAINIAMDSVTLGMGAEFDKAIKKRLAKQILANDTAPSTMTAIDKEIDAAGDPYGDRIAKQAAA
ncbi:arylamine N-acetyltransferase [Methylomonas sp. EFPC1]|uniref:arylamine N-acetyltransferase family protein n=1 Tax=Methylomonas sp. EFPC1 TaxID=2812647 RepID=UPI001F07D2C0|nr:arylamine N-acetyltransferase [Methylomonas sp. EFPC1]